MCLDDERQPGTTTGAEGPGRSGAVNETAATIATATLIWIEWRCVEKIKEDEIVIHVMAAGDGEVWGVPAAHRQRAHPAAPAAAQASSCGSSARQALRVQASSRRVPAEPFRFSYSLTLLRHALGRTI